MADPLLNKARDFTTGDSPKGGETRVLEIWLVIALQAARLLPLKTAQALVRMIQREPVGLAGRSLATGLFAEHYRSLLADAPDGFQPDQAKQLEELRADFEAVVSEFLALEEPVPQRPEEDHDLRI